MLQIIDLMLVCHIWIVYSKTPPLFCQSYSKKKPLFCLKGSGDPIKPSSGVKLSLSELGGRNHVFLKISSFSRPNRDFSIFQDLLQNPQKKYWKIYGKIGKFWKIEKSRFRRLKLEIFKNPWFLPPNSLRPNFTPEDGFIVPPEPFKQNRGFFLL